MADKNILNADNEKLEISQENDKPTKEVALQRLREFAYYFVENFEETLKSLLNILEDKNAPKPPNSTIVNALSVASFAIPTVGKGIGSTLKESEVYILKKVTKNKSRSLANLLYKYSDEKNELRQEIIAAALELFYVFEFQFMKLKCEGGPRRAMQKLATDAVNRFINYILVENCESIGSTEIIKGVINGQSEGRTVNYTEEKDEGQWKTNKIYMKVGIIFEGKYYYNFEKSRHGIYGFRKSFQFEIVEQNWRREFEPVLQDYQPEREDLNPEPILEYILNKTTEGVAALDRKIKHEETIEYSKKNHDEFMIFFANKIGDIERNFDKILGKKHEETRAILSDILEDKSKAQREDLEKVREEINETKQNQIELRQRIDNEKTIKIDIKEVERFTKHVGGTFKDKEGGVQKVGKEIEKVAKKIGAEFEKDGDIVKKEHDRTKAKLKKNVQMVMFCIFAIPWQNGRFCGTKVTFLLPGCKVTTAAIT